MSGDCLFAKLYPNQCNPASSNQESYYRIDRNNRTEFFDTRGLFPFALFRKIIVAQDFVATILIIRASSHLWLEAFAVG